MSGISPNPYPQIQELLGIVAVSTFLVGFSTVRVQTSLQEWRQEGVRILDRLLEQNSGDDLLPVPTTIERLVGTQQSKLKLDSITWLTVFITFLTLLTSLIVFAEEVFGPTASRTVQQIQIIHLSIFILGLLDITRVRLVKKRELNQSTVSRYRRLETAIFQWLREQSPVNQKKVLSLCDELDSLIPDWCWLSLIRFEVLQWSDNPIEYLRQSARRIELLAKRSKDVDDYSRLAYVWSNYLLEPVKASQVVTLSDIKHVCKFSRRLSESGDPDAIVALAVYSVHKSTLRDADSELEAVLRSARGGSW